MTPTGRLLLELLGSGPVSRAELARRLGLSTPTLTRLSKPLVDRGLVRETVEVGPARAGRPSRPLEVVAGAAHFAGVKISRDGVDGVVIDLTGTVLQTHRVDLAGAGASAAVGVAATVLEELTADPVVARVAVAVGGRVDAGRLSGPVAGFGDAADPFGPSLLEQLQAITPVPVELINDVHAYLLAELWLGSGRRSSELLVLTVGVGVGCAYAVDGRLITGAGGTAGSVGHWPLTPAGPVCEQGHAGCASGWLPADRVLDRVALTCGERLDLESAVRRAADDDRIATVLEKASFQLGRLTALVADALGPSRIVLGGDAISYVRFAELQVRQGLATRRAVDAGSDLVVNPDSGFGEWARGAAVAALGTWVEQVAGSGDQH